MTIDLYIKKMVNYLNLTLEISFSTLKALNMNFSQNELYIIIRSIDTKLKKLV